MIDEDPELFLEEGARVRASIDPFIAALFFRPKSNNPTEGYHLALTANFGEERLQLKTAHESFDFKLEIFKAEIKLDAAFCRFDPFFEKDKSTEGRIPSNRENAKTGQHRTARFNADTGELIEAVLGARVEFELQTKSANETEVESWYEVRFLDDTTIEISSCGSKPVALSGPILNEFVGWHILPEQKRDSGVIGRIRVREDWIRLTDPRPVGRTGKIWSGISRMLKGQSDEDKQRRKAFHILLTHLVSTGLQEASNSRDATLAIDTVIVRHLDECCHRALIGEAKPNIDVDGSVLSRFLKSKYGSEVNLLRNLGISENRLQSLETRSNILPASNASKPEISVPELEFLSDYLDQISKTKLREELHRDLAEEVLMTAVLGGRLVTKIDIGPGLGKAYLIEVNILVRPQEAKNLIVERSALNHRKVKNLVGGQLMSFRNMVDVGFPLSGALSTHKQTVLKMVDAFVRDVYGT